MSLHTKIEWAHHTANFWWGCTKVSPGCEHCYAERLAKFFSRGRATWGRTGARWIRHEAARRELDKLDASARERGVRERVFINSMSDTFEDRADLAEARAALWDACHHVTHLDLLLLTKRPENVCGMVPSDWLKWHWPAHVWIGTTVENQPMADQRIPLLCRIPAAVRFLSCEPLLGPVNLGLPLRLEEVTPIRIDDGRVIPIGPTVLQKQPPSEIFPEANAALQWVIAGGESGGRARPMRAEWARALRDQCAAAGVPFFFKQWGEFTPTHDVEGAMYRAGKKHAGRALDGFEHSAFPATPAATIA